MIYKFGEFQLDQNRHELRRGDQTIAIEPQVYDLIHLIVSKQGELVTRDEMIEIVWGGRIVSESAISARIASARKALGDDGKAQRIIQTVSRRGLRLAVEVVLADEVTKPSPVPPAEQPKPPIHFARAEDGTQIAFIDAGEGIPIFCAAHFPSYIDSEWDNRMDGLTFREIARRERLIQMDYRGSGHTGGSVPDDPLSAAASDIKAVLDHLGIEKTNLFGQSNGALVSLTFAHLFPDRVGRIVVQGGYAQGRQARKGEPSETEAISLMIKEGWSTPGSSFVGSYISTYFPDASPDQINFAIKNVQSSASADAVLKMRETINQADITSILPNISAPTLVMHSKDDTVHPLSEAQKVARSLPNASMTIFDNRNHYILETDDLWPEFIEALLGFLASD